MIRLYSSNGKVIVNPKDYNFPTPGTPAWDNLEINVKNESSDRPIKASIADDGILHFEEESGDIFYVEFEDPRPSSSNFRVTKSRSMLLTKKKSRQLARAKSKIARESRKRNRT